MALPAHLPAVAADPSPRNRLFVQPSPWVTNKNVRISAGAGTADAQFGLADLANYAPKWKIPPTVWQEYPAALDDIPLITRTYSPDTVAYLAQHEVRRGDRTSLGVALTFDCEYSPESARHILDTLRQESVRATFFLQGRFVYRNPELIRQMHADGHELGSHSFFHPRFTELPAVDMTKEITYTEAAIAWAVGEYVSLRFFRFPYAGRNQATREHVASLGYQSSFWNLDPRGWDPAVSAQDVVDAIWQHVHAGSIIIMHCSSWDDALALPGTIRVIRSRGLAPGTLTDVLLPEDRDVPGYQILPDS
jgi:peptidoglycan/xylan/chitin deacetylase (PgdA/CDA1 family)